MFRTTYLQYGNFLFVRDVKGSLSWISTVKAKYCLWHGFSFKLVDGRSSIWQFIVPLDVIDEVHYPHPVLWTNGGGDGGGGGSGGVGGP